LPSGTYTVRAQKEGFQTAEADNVILHVEELKGLNLILNPGSVRQAITVTDKAPLLNTEQARLAQDMNQHTLDSVPSEGENPLSVVALLPGVVGVTPGNNNIFAVADNANVNVGGLRSSSNNYQIDGTTVTETPNGGTMNIAPTMDEIAELHVTTNNFSAEHGRSAGFQLDAVTKSGTNEFHGDAYYYGIAAELNANSFFSNSAPPNGSGHAYKPRFDQNMFGGSVGGPIKRDKAFFFGSYSGLRERGGSSSITSSPVAVVNVETAQFAQYVQSTFPQSIAAALFSKYPAVPQAQFNLVTAAQYSDGLYAKHTDFPADLPVVGQAITSQPVLNDGDHYLGRFDYNISDRDRFYASFMQTYILNTSGPNPRPQFALSFPEGDSFFSITEDHSFSSTLLNEAKFGFSRTGSFVPGNNLNVPQIGLNDGVAGFGISGSIPFGFFQMNYEWKDILTKYLGKHNLSAGVEFRRGHDDFDSVSRPAYSFQNILDFAQDKPYAEGEYVGATTGLPKGPDYEERTFESAAFFEDDYKVRSNLTLNLGLRWEDYHHATENFHQFSSFIFGTGSTLGQEIANGSMQLRPDPWHSRNFNFAPRFGYSWNPRARWVIRGGFGVTYDRMPNGDWEGLADNPPAGPAFATVGLFNGNTPVVYGLGGTGPYYGFPVDTALATGLNAQNGIAGQQIGVAAVDPNLKVPYVYNWLQGVQLEISPAWMVEADYIGTAAHHQAWINNIDRFDGDLLTGATFTGFTPSFSSIGYLQSRANSTFNALSFTVRHPLTHRLSLNAVYTWSKAIDNTDSDGSDAVDINNVQAERGVAGFDHAQKFVAYAIWELPALNSQSSLVRQVAGGWQLSPIVTAQSGAPFNVFCGKSFDAANPSQGCDWNADGTNNDRPDAPSFGLTISNPGNSKFIQGVFPASAFPAPAVGTLGGLGRNVYIGPGFFGTDLSLRKTFTLYSERWKLQFRADAFNLFNRVNLTGVDGNLADGTFGQSTATYNSREIQLGLKLSF